MNTSCSHEQATYDDKTHLRGQQLFTHYYHPSYTISRISTWKSDLTLCSLHLTTLLRHSHGPRRGRNDWASHHKYDKTYVLGVSSRDSGWSGFIQCPIVHVHSNSRQNDILVAAFYTKNALCNLHEWINCPFNDKSAWDQPYLGCTYSYKIQCKVACFIIVKVILGHFPRTHENISTTKKPFMVYSANRHKCPKWLSVI